MPDRARPDPSGCTQYVTAPLNPITEGGEVQSDDDSYDMNETEVNQEGGDEMPSESTGTTRVKPESKSTKLMRFFKREISSSAEGIKQKSTY